MSNHETIGLFTALTDARGEAWKDRGYALAATSNGFGLEGDIGQFYLDAVSRELDAHLALEFLRKQGSEAWNDVLDLAKDDGIDLVESQEVFLMGAPVEDHVARL